ncbi:hypothetical protein [Nocardia farcinica]|uniref:hypothetical protein n=1 Tax=Nocardia farcinica TaxID=37329 RepID=UPI002456A0E1|nr:hypothetical protein [Nocardia farcinica]
MSDTYSIGDLVRTDSNRVWRVDRLYTGKDGRPAVDLVNPDNPSHGTSLYADVLDRVSTRVDSARDRQYRDLANVIAQQAEAIALGKVPAGQLHAQVRRLASNVDTLAAWTPDDRRP